MNEVNTTLQTEVGINTIVNLIKITSESIRKKFKDTKVITTVLTNFPAKDWRVFTKELVEKAGGYLDGIGYDHYPGTYELPAGVPVVGKTPYEAYANIEPYEWIVDQKLNGVLKDKEVIISETGAPAIFPNVESRAMQTYGMDRIVQALDHLFLKIERENKNVKAKDVISAVGFFQPAMVEDVKTKFPLKLDFLPWTIMHKDKKGKWQLTYAGERLKELIAIWIKGKNFSGTT